LSACGAGSTTNGTTATQEPKVEASTSAKPSESPATSPTNNKEQVVNVFTARHYAVDTEIFAAFTKQTGIKVNEIKGTAEELVERLKREGTSTEADLFITVDGGVLNYAKQNGVLQAIQSPAIDQNVPKEWRDKDN